MPLFEKDDYMACFNKLKEVHWAFCTGLGQCKHGIHKSRLFKHWQWHIACTWPNFIGPACPPLWLSVLSVEVLCEQLAWRLQAPQWSHLISSGGPRGLQRWGNTIHKEPLIWTGPLYIANKTPQRLFDCIWNLLDNSFGLKEGSKNGFAILSFFSLWFSHILSSLKTLYVMNQLIYRPFLLNLLAGKINSWVCFFFFF